MNTESAVFFHDPVSAEARVKKLSTGSYFLGVTLRSDGDRHEVVMYFDDLRSLVGVAKAIESQVMDYLVEGE